MKKILLISSEFPPGPGGIGRHAADLSLALNNKGFLVKVFSTLDYTENSKVNDFICQLQPGIELVPLKRCGWKTYIYRVRVIFKELNRTQYERIIVTGMFPLWVGGLIKVIYGSKHHVDFFVHGSEVNPGNWLMRLFTHRALKKADVIWAVSGFTASLLPGSIQNKKDIQILPNGIHIKDWEFFNGSPYYTHWQGYPKLLTVGSISPRKGQHRVINALPEIIKIFPDVHYHIVGINSNEKSLYELTKTLGVGKHVTIHGRLEGKGELASAYKTSDIFIMLSENQADGDVEGFGIAILEANYWGIPSIGAKGCGIEDAIMNQVNGILVKGDDSSEITNAVKNILENKTGYQSNLCEWVQKHDWNSIVEKFIAKK